MTTRHARAPPPWRNRYARGRIRVVRPGVPCYRLLFLVACKRHASFTAGAGRNLYKKWQRRFPANLHCVRTSWRFGGRGVDCFRLNRKVRGRTRSPLLYNQKTTGGVGISNNASAAAVDLPSPSSSVPPSLPPSPLLPHSPFTLPPPPPPQTNGIPIQLLPLYSSYSSPKSSTSVPSSKGILALKNRHEATA